MDSDRLGNINMESEQDWNPKNKTEKDSVAACGNQKDDRNLAAASAEKRMSIALAVLLGDFGQHSLDKCVA